MHDKRDKKKGESIEAIPSSSFFFFFFKDSNAATRNE